MEALKIYEYASLSEDNIEELVSRNVDSTNKIAESTSAILEHIKTARDKGLKELTLKYDKVRLDKLYLDKDEIQEIALRIGRQEQRALEIAFSNIHRYHSLQTKRERKLETMPGVTCWRELRPIEKVGLYIPGGSAVLPSTLLMLGVPARIAGCKEIVVCSPAQTDGLINPYIAYCLTLLRIEKIYLVGGAQAIAAMAFGTESIPKVDKIFGPGNQYVTKAKTLVQQESRVAIDMPAGPSEVLVIADQSCNPAFVAADLLAQAEHGPDSQAILVSNSAPFIKEVDKEIQKQLETLPRTEIARQALANSYAVHTTTLEEALDFSNKYAPEHLIIALEDYQQFIPRILNAGSVFLGPLSPESVGDYASGTNHTLPTSGYARSYSGVSVDSFVKKITFQHISPDGIQHIGPTVEILAGMEELEGHKRSVSIRLKEQP